MAQFQEVMRQWHRRFESEKNLVDDKIVGIDALWLAMDDPEKIENMVMSWAAEHPEPVYPTWEEWLADVGVLVCDTSFPNKRYWYAINRPKLEQPIPADIAQKLGIEPKERT